MHYICWLKTFNLPNICWYASRPFIEIVYGNSHGYFQRFTANVADGMKENWKQTDHLIDMII